MNPVIKILSLGAALFAGVKIGQYLSKPRIFISFAIEDIRTRDLLKGQTRNKKVSFDFIDKSVQEPWENAWKTNCKKRIDKCHGMIALISQNTKKADGQIWEMQYAQKQELPLLAIYANKKSKSCRLPKQLTGLTVEAWSWPTIENFINELDNAD